MKKQLLAIVIFFALSLNAASSENLEKAGYLLTKIVNQAQKDVGVSEDRRAAVYGLVVPKGYTAYFGGMVAIDKNGQLYIAINPKMLASYPLARFYAAHEATHVLNEDPKVIAGMTNKLDQLSYVIKSERRADTTAVLALKCKTCLYEYIKDDNIESIDPDLLHRGYLSAQEMRALSEKYHSDTPCYYHSSPLPRIFYAIQSIPTKHLPLYGLLKDIHDKKKLFKNSIIIRIRGNHD